jgi:acetamidase/formamidase
MGQIGTSPSTAIPDSHNGGDFGSFLIGAPHRYALSAQELQRHKTDGHTDVDAVRAGAILVCPVKLDGGEQDLPFLAKSLSREERPRALELGRRYGVSELEESLPISVIGTGPDLNSATDNGLARAAELLDLSVPEVKNRATIAGAIEIGRHPGVVQVTFRAPVERLQARGLLGYAIEQYGR